MSFPSPSTVAQSLSSLLLADAGVPGPIGALILGVIFPDDPNAVPAYFTQVFAEIQAIVSQDITQNEIDLINGKIQGAVNYCITTYTPIKNAGGTTNADLLADITPYVTDLNSNVIETLQESDFAQVGFAAFLAAAPIYLSLLQEQALVDPAVGNPWLSGYTQAIVNNAGNFVTAAQTNWAAVKQARRDQVTVTSTYGPTLTETEDCDPEAKPNVDFPVPPPNICYSWSDAGTNTTGQSYCGYGWPSDSEQQARLAQAQADCTAQQDAVVAALTTNLGDPDAIISTWQQLQATPLPIPRPA